ncbi:MAG: hypothetical protein HGA45_17065 [Chloroflexales bacterium]|nr:hypothetical protein [Chloroflexales bacterium]
MALTLKPPAPIVLPEGVPSVFLAGSIAMGRAAPWQAAVEAALAHAGGVLLNPRRDDWDPAWPQDAGHPRMRAQIEWELAGLERAGLVAMYFAPETQAPVTLLELGLVARDGRLVVCCPPGFWRRANVEIVCERYGVPMVPDLQALIAYVARFLAA